MPTLLPPKIATRKTLVAIILHLLPQHLQQKTIEPKMIETQNIIPKPKNVFHRHPVISTIFFVFVIIGVFLLLFKKYPDTIIDHNMGAENKQCISDCNVEYSALQEKYFGSTKDIEKVIVQKHWINNFRNILGGILPMIIILGLVLIAMVWAVGMVDKKRHAHPLKKVRAFCEKYVLTTHSLRPDEEYVDIEPLKLGTSMYVYYDRRLKRVIGYEPAFPGRIVFDRFDDRYDFKRELNRDKFVDEYLRLFAEKGVEVNL